VSVVLPSGDMVPLHGLPSNARVQVVRALLSEKRPPPKHQRYELVFDGRTLSDREQLPAPGSSLLKLRAIAEEPRLAWKPRGSTSHCALKVVLVGDSSTGKTRLLTSCARGAAPRVPMATIGVSCTTCAVELADRRVAHCQIWDTAGNEVYRQTSLAHLCDSVGALLVYDITSRATFASCTTWETALRERAPEGIAIMLVGNKLDHAEGDPSARQVSRLEAEAFAEHRGLLFAETSAAIASRDSVQAIFERLFTRAACVQAKKPSPQGMSRFRQERDVDVLDAEIFLASRRGAAGTQGGGYAWCACCVQR